MTVGTLKAGIGDFVTTPPSGCDLCSAVRHGLARSEAALHRAQQIQVLRARQQLLSRREREVMTLVCVGRLNKQIGHELGISEITVKAHRGRVMRKMRAQSLAEMVRMAATLEQQPDPLINYSR